MAFQVSAEIQTFIDLARKQLLQSNNSEAADNYSSAGTLTQKHAMNYRGLDRSIGLIQAAELYYKASDYPLSYNVLSGIDSASLPDKWQMIFAHYFRVSCTRIDKNWTPKRADLLSKLHKNKKWRKLLKLLSDCPYVLDQVKVAKMRAEACRELGKIDAAKQFDLDAKKLAGEDWGGHVSNYD